MPPKRTGAREPTEAELNALVYALLKTSCPKAAKAFKKTETVVMDAAGAETLFDGKGLTDLVSAALQQRAKSKSPAAKPAAKKAAAKKKAQEEESSSSSDSDSDSSDSSSSSSSADTKPKKSPQIRPKPTAKAAAKKRKRSAQRDDDHLQKKNELWDDGTGWEEEGRTRYWKPGGTGRSNKGTVNHFCRIDVSKVSFASAQLRDNRYETLRPDQIMQEEFTYKAHCDLIKTQGKGFTKAKNKKKKANYRAGVIDQLHQRSYQFSDSD